MAMFNSYVKLPEGIYICNIYIYFTCSRDTPSTVLSVPWERNKRRPHQGGESEGQNSQKKKTGTVGKPITKTIIFP